MTTPAVKLAQQRKIDFKLHEYEHDPRQDSYGQEAVEKLGLLSTQVFKTLIVELSDSRLATVVIPVDYQVSLKKVAAHFGNKKAKLAEPRKVENSSGYVLGGVSPLGQNRSLPTLIDASAQHLGTMFVSAGKRGLEIELSPADLKELCNARFADIRHDK